MKPNFTIFLTILLTLLTPVLSKASQSPFSVKDNDSVDVGAAGQCCAILSEHLPTMVHFPDSFEYKAQQSRYFLLQQTDIQPSCRVSPESPSDVSRILQIAKEHSCSFAVRSGGHMSWTASNIAGGVTIDLGKLNVIEINDEKNVVRLGPGSTWKEVYAVMQSSNLTTVGGRMPEVGVGGFFLGGGISLLSFEQGFGCDNILNYEVVLSNGSIVNANLNQHPELYWALKLGSTNYGIVTRFDVAAYPLDDVWGGLRVYPVTDKTPQLVENWVSFARTLASVRSELQALILGRSMDNGMVSAVSTIWHASLDAVAGPSLISSTPIVDTTRRTRLVDLVDDLQSSDFADKKRVMWHTFTIKHDSQFVWDMFTHARERLHSVEHADGLHWDIAFQPITKGIIAAGSKNGGNPFQSVLMDSDADLTLVCLLISWVNASDDETMEQVTLELGSWGEEAARQNGILNDYIYLNYASEHQPVYERSVSKNDLAKMRRVKEMYDPGNVLGHLWRGGFKIPKETEEGEVESRKHTEL